jgi:hypothetical protein
LDELVRRDLRPDSEAEIFAHYPMRSSGGAHQGRHLGMYRIFLLVNQHDLLGFPVFDTIKSHVEIVIDSARDARSKLQPLKSFVGSRKLLAFGGAIRESL